MLLPNLGIGCGPKDQRGGMTPSALSAHKTWPPRCVSVAPLCASVKQREISDGTGSVHPTQLPSAVMTPDGNWFWGFLVLKAETLAMQRQLRCSSSACKRLATAISGRRELIHSPCDGWSFLDLCPGDVKVMTQSCPCSTEVWATDSMQCCAGPSGAHAGGTQGTRDRIRRGVSLSWEPPIDHKPRVFYLYLNSQHYLGQIAAYMAYLGELGMRHAGVWPAAPKWRRGGCEAGDAAT